VSVKKGAAVFTDFVTAGVDPTKFPDPYEIKLDRPDDLYIHHGWGPHSCLGRDIVTVAGASMLRACAQLGPVRRAPGPAGEMKSKVVNGAFKVYLSEDGSAWGPFPIGE
jgi:cytochrome P450